MSLAGCGDGDDATAESALAEELCAALENGQPIQHRAAISSATETVEEEDLDGGAFFAEVAERCQDAFSAAFGIDADDDSPADAELAAEVSLELDECSSSAAAGTVTNDSDETLRVTVEARFVDDDDVLLDTNTTVVRGFRAGETGAWSVSFLGDGYARCTVNVTDIRGQ